VRIAVPASGLLGALALLVLAAPVTVAAQQPGADEGWPAPAIGVRIGFDQSASGEVIGAQLRVPVLPSGRIELVPNADITFLNNLREYGFNVDAVFVSGGRQGGLYLGGGLAMRNSVFTAQIGGARETEVGFGAVVGLKGGGPAGLVSQVEFRWSFLPDVDYDPRAITLGLNFPFWGRDSSR
jgi:hypothetical protein